MSETNELTQDEKREIILKNVSEMCAEMLSSSRIVARLLGKMYQNKKDLGLELPEIVRLMAQNHLEMFEEVLEEDLIFCGVEPEKAKEELAKLRNLLFREEK